jgi:hypothetical protein
MKNPLEIPNMFKIGPKFRIVYMKTWVRFVVSGDITRTLHTFHHLDLMQETFKPRKLGQGFEN